MQKSAERYGLNLTITDTDKTKTPTERLEEERDKPLSEQPAPVEVAPTERPMHNDQDLARRLSFALDRDGVDVEPDTVILSERYTDPDAPPGSMLSQLSTPAVSRAVSTASCDTFAYTSIVAVSAPLGRTETSIPAEQADTR